MQLEIITRDRQIFQGMVTGLTVPGSAGCFQILVDHAPIVTTLQSGKVSYTDGAEKHELFIEKGILSVHDNQIKLLVEVETI